MSNLCYQINLSTVFGGAEVYTRFFSQALRDIGWDTVIFVNKKSTFWQSMEQDGFKLIPVEHYRDIASCLPGKPSLLITHERLSGSWAEELRQKHILAGFAHQPLHNRPADPYRLCHLLFAVSQHVIDSLQSAGITQFYPKPLYGVADINRTAVHNPATPIISRSPYHWDRRKARDRLFSVLYPLYRKIAPVQTFSRQTGLTLGIVSRFDSIKQFPLLFRFLSPVIRKFPEVRIEIFGSGGYASVRDLKQSLAPIRSQVRFWGHQNEVRSIYPQLDFLLPGLPEREALGLNVIEAQLCGTPVLAINAPPFAETVLDGKTGFLYTDPRLDQGRDFESLLERLSRTPTFPNPLDAPEHLTTFSFEQFKIRVAAAMEYATHHVFLPATQATLPNR